MLDDFPQALADRVRERLADMPQAVQDSVEAQMAISAAQEIDAGRQLSIAPVMKELRTLMEQLRAWSVEQAQTGDDIDELTKRRAERRGETG